MLRGTVTEFDEAKGLGTVASDDAPSSNVTPGLAGRAAWVAFRRR